MMLKGRCCIAGILLILPTIGLQAAELGATPGQALNSGSRMKLAWASLRIYPISTHALSIGHESPDVLTPKEVATLLRVNVETVELMAAAETIPSRKVQLHNGSQTLRFSREALMAWLENRQARSATSMAKGFSAAPLFTKPASTDTEAAQAELEPDAPIGEQRKGLSSTEAFLREQSVVDSKGGLSMDLGIFYGRQESQLLINDENPRLETITSRTGSAQAVFRYSLSGKTELAARTRADFQSSRLSFNNRSRRLDDPDYSLDAAIGFRHVFLDERLGRPEMIFGLEAQIPTSTSSPGVSSSLSFVKSLDPAVLFGSLNFSYIDSKNFDDIALLEYKYSTRANVGYALALNDQLSVNFSLEAGFRGRTRFEQVVLPQDDYAALQFGTTIKLSRTLYVQPVIGYSLTSVGSAYTLGVNFPLTFD